MAGLKTVGSIMAKSKEEKVFLLIWLHMKFDPRFVKLLSEAKNVLDGDTETSVRKLEKRCGSYRKEIPISQSAVNDTSRTPESLQSKVIAKGGLQIHRQQHLLLALSAC